MVCGTGEHYNLEELRLNAKLGTSLIRLAGDGKVSSQLQRKSFELWLAALDVKECSDNYLLLVLLEDADNHRLYLSRDGETPLTLVSNPT